MPPFPDAFVRTILGIHGQAGEAWIQGLPRRIAECEERWKLVVQPPFDLSYNYVAPAAMTSTGGDTSEIVLKIGVLGPDVNREFVALHHFNGKGCARVMYADSNLGAMVIERLKPGITLDRAIPDDQATAAIAADIMQQLWRPVPAAHNMPALGDWFAGFDRHRARYEGTTEPLPDALFAHAESLAAHLLHTTPDTYLLHGDLHHGNILTSDRAGYLAIDPKGVTGDPAFEPSAFFLNPHPVTLEATKKRLDIFAEALNIDRERIRGWGIARAVLSACWTLEDNGDDYAPALAVAEQLIAARSN